MFLTENSEKADHKDERNDDLIGNEADARK